MAECIQCRKEFHRISKPVWAFFANLQTAGQVHTTCAGPWRRARGLKWGYADSGGSEDHARRLAWMQSKGQDTGIRTRIIFLDETPEERERHYAWWASPDNPKFMVPGERQRIEQEVGRLEDEYRKALPAEVAR